MKKSKSNIIGIRACIEAIESGKEFDKLLFRKEIKSDLYQELFKIVNQKNIPFQFVPVEKLNRISSGNHQGVIGLISPITYQDIEMIIPMLFEQGKNPFILVLDQITDVRNFGAICRTAECVGVHAVVVPVKGSAQIGSDAIKTSAGALNHLPVCRVKNLTQTLNFLKESGLKVVAASEKAKNDYNSVNYEGPLVIIMGSEEKGISPVLLGISDELVKIPMVGNIASLNVSVATGVILYEAFNKRPVLEDQYQFGKQEK